MNASNPAAGAPNRAGNSDGVMLRLVRSEPKKAAALGCLLLLMGLLWLKVLGGNRALPTSASASGSDSPDPVKTAPAVSDVAPKLLEWRRQSPKPLARNLFQIQYDRFPSDGVVQPAQSPQGAFWEQVAKSMDFKADQEKDKKDRVDALRKEAAKLKPKATMSVNGTRTAVIDGILAGEGDMVDGFRILRIAADRIVVEKNGMRLEVLSDGK